MSCRHLFVNVGCAECAADPEKPRATKDDVIQFQMLELAKLRDAFEDAIALLRDWEDYDVGDRECMWPKRREEFLAEHEEAGR